MKNEASTRTSRPVSWLAIIATVAILVTIVLVSAIAWLELSLATGNGLYSEEIQRRRVARETSFLLLAGAPLGLTALWACREIVSSGRRRRLATALLGLTLALTLLGAAHVYGFAFSSTRSRASG